MTAPQEKPRYFYRDPLAAAWMAKHQGVKFANKDSLRSACEAVGTNGRDMQTLGGCFYLHADSPGLLEPRVGDIVLNCDGIPALVGIDNAMNDIYRQYRIPLREAKEWVGTSATVIQRNGQAFMWPEQEAV